MTTLYEKILPSPDEVSRREGWRMCGNSVCPPLATAIAAANLEAA